MNPDLWAGLARPLAGLAGALHLTALTALARLIARDLDSPQWADTQLSRTGQLVEQLTVPVERTTTGLVAALTDALTRATAAARRATRKSLPPPAARQAPLPAVIRLPVAVADAETGRALGAVTGRVLRDTADAHRDIVAAVTRDVLTGGVTRRQAAQHALDQLADRGLGGIVDRAGRRWAPETYVEMATRTTIRRAALDAQAETLTIAGEDLVIVDDHAQECEQCRPWEGRVLTLTGATTGQVTRASEVGDGRVTVTVAGSLREAEAAGLGHPGCRHQWTRWVPGIPAQRRTADPDGDRARQQLRALERRARRWQAREAVALDDAARARARAYRRAAQADIRQHTRRTGLVRQPHRERIGTPR